MEPKVELSPDELEALKPSFERIKRLREQVDEIISTISPFLVLIAKNHGLEPSLYMLSDDGLSLVLRK